MNKTEYVKYTDTVEKFFKKEGLVYLTRSYDTVFFSCKRCDCCSSILPGNRLEARGYNPVEKRVHKYAICIDCKTYAIQGRRLKIT